MERPQLTEVEVNEVFCDLQKTTAFRLNQKGRGIIISRHEMLGIITEEFIESIIAVEKGTLASIEDELTDIAVACIVSLASIKTGKVQW